MMKTWTQTDFTYADMVSHEDFMASLAPADGEREEPLRYLGHQLKRDGEADRERRQCAGEAGRRA